MMIAALEQAGQDSGAPRLLQRADSIYVLRGVWGYGDPGRGIAGRLGATVQETVGTPFGGNFAQACVIDGAREIRAGRREVVLVVGAENSRSVGQARKQGIELRESEAPGAPDRKLAEDKAIFHDAELARGMNSAGDVFAVVESAIRHARGESLEAHSERLAELWADFNAVACQNPNAWFRKPYSAREIGRAGPDNPMISHPYTRRMNANAQGRHGSGPSSSAPCETARAAGVPEEKLVFPCTPPPRPTTATSSRRGMDFHRSPAMRIAGRQGAGAGGEGRSPRSTTWMSTAASPRQYRSPPRELGLPDDRPLTVTGGLTFARWPAEPATRLHAIARMAEVLREEPRLHRPGQRATAAGSPSTPSRSTPHSRRRRASAPRSSRTRSTLSPCAKP